jgi:O-antigen/teichoic acid export membrane protein
VSSDEDLSQSAGRESRDLVRGTAYIFAADALLVPTGILTAAYLSRHFGSEGYGLLTLVSVLIVWLESNVALALSRPAIKLVGESKDWQLVGTTVLRLYVLAGLGLGAAVWAVSGPLSRLMAEGALSNYLRLLALDLPIFCAAQAHRNILVGLGRFRERAYIGAARLIARLLLIVTFAALSRSVAGAIWGSLFASLVELIVCRIYIRPRLFLRGAYAMRRLCGYALPLIMSALCMSLYSRLDLLLLKPLGATTTETGIYSIAQNLALLPSLFAFAFAPALLSTLSRLLSVGDSASALRVGRHAMRAVLLSTPLAALIAGAAPDLIVRIFGPEFLPAATLLRLLIFASLALLMISVTTGIMTAAGKPAWTLHCAWPLALAALAGHIVFIPLAGPVGAAWVTTAFAIAGAIATVCLVQRLWRIGPSAKTLWRSLAVSAPAYMIASLSHTTGLSLVLKLIVAGLFVIAALLLLGEFSAGEISAIRAMLNHRLNPAIEARGRTPA